MKTILSKLLILTVLLLLASLPSCVKQPAPKPTPGKDQEQEDDDKDDNKPVVETDPARLKFLSFSFAPEHNGQIYSEVALTASGNTLSGDILYYRTDLTQLAASFETNGAKVTVGSTEQKAALRSTTSPKRSPTGFTPRGPIPGVQGHGAQPLLFGAAAAGALHRRCRARLLEGDMDPGYDAHRPAGERLRRVFRTDRNQGARQQQLGERQKPYAIKLAEKQPVMGMNKHKRWALLANASDKTLLRNRVAFEIAKHATALDWTPDSRYVDVILNGRFLGNYLLTEQIKIDKNRVALAEMDPAATSGDAITGGYLLELDRYFDEVNKFRSAFADLPVNFKEPDEEGLNSAQFNYMKDYFNAVEALLYAPDFPAAGEYAELLDTDSFIDWWIVQELTHNQDTRLPGSCYMNKDRLGKLKAGPVWDFDLTTFIDSRSFLLKDESANNHSWFPRLFRDPAFRQRVRERWQAIRPSLEQIPAFIDSEAAYIQKAAWQNWGMWEYEIARSDVNHDEKLSWNDAVAALQTNYANRLAWMDAQIAAL
ncbi:MAG: CotH kinase family protein [Alistipes indistinctus]